MQKSTIPLVITALLPVAYGIKKLIDNNSLQHTEMNRSLGEHFKDEYQNLKLNSHQRKEIYSILKNKTADASDHIKQVLNDSQRGLYDKLCKK
jgi:hypothetical protein